MNLIPEISDGRFHSLEEHLQQENPVLLQAVQRFRDLDKIAYRMGLLESHQSFAMQIPWWPLISILGTFSAGKSSFVNHYLGHKLQRTGNQAVDDRFSVICYSQDPIPRNLPGVALDQDPRFPFYQISKDLEQVAPGEGSRIDAYLQLRTCASERLRGKILIDSPGFDADAQRNATLRITDYIINLSDLVLVLFDARHPEPGAMQDTLQHLVSKTIHRPDSGKFMYILNQLDTTAREDNPEDVVAAWQRALGEKGLTAGRFYAIYNPDVAIPIEDEAIRHRFETKRDADLAEIHGRMQHVGIERAYRIVGTLEKTARDLSGKIIPFLTQLLTRWRNLVLWVDLAMLIGSLIGLALIDKNLIQAATNSNGWLIALIQQPILRPVAAIALASLILLAHFGIRATARWFLTWGLERKATELGLRGNITGAFQRSTRAWRSIFLHSPAGWNRKTQQELQTIISNTDDYVQTLNNRFANPSGENKA
jgi:GTPase SAR1 family protein